MVVSQVDSNLLFRRMRFDPTTCIRLLFQKKSRKETRVQDFSCLRSVSPLHRLALSCESLRLEEARVCQDSV